MPTRTLSHCNYSQPPPWPCTRSPIFAPAYPRYSSLCLRMGSGSLVVPSSSPRKKFSEKLKFSRFGNVQISWGTSTNNRFSSNARVSERPRRAVRAEIQDCQAGDLAYTRVQAAIEVVIKQDELVQVEAHASSAQPLPPLSTPSSQPPQTSPSMPGLIPLFVSRLARGPIVTRSSRAPPCPPILSPSSSNRAPSNSRALSSSSS